MDVQKPVMYTKDGRLLSLTPKNSNNQLQFDLLSLHLECDPSLRKKQLLQLDLAMGEGFPGVVGGDYNSVLQPHLYTNSAISKVNQGENNVDARLVEQAWMATAQLQDVFRTLNPELQIFSRVYHVTKAQLQDQEIIDDPEKLRTEQEETNSTVPLARRIDRFLISSSLLTSCKEVEYLNLGISDHKIVQLVLNMPVNAAQVTKPKAIAMWPTLLDDEWTADVLSRYKGTENEGLADRIQRMKTSMTLATLTQKDKLRAALDKIPWQGKLKKLQELQDSYILTKNDVLAQVVWWTKHRTEEEMKECKTFNDVAMATHLSNSLKKTQQNLWYHELHKTIDNNIHKHLQKSLPVHKQVKKLKAKLRNNLINFNQKTNWIMRR